MALLLGTGAEAAAQGAAVELEVARKPGLYLVVDAAAGKLEVRSRGLTLDAAALLGAEVRFYRPAWGEVEVRELPAGGWRVATDAPAEYRQVVAPLELRPYPEAADAGGGGAATGGPMPAAGTASAAGAVEPPTSYRVQLEEGWELRIGPGMPEAGWVRRLGSTLSRGWWAWRGRPQPAPPTLVLVLEAGDAQRLHHLFRAGLPILLVPVPPVSVSETRVQGPARDCRPPVAGRHSPGWKGGGTSAWSS